MFLFVPLLVSVFFLYFLQINITGLHIPVTPTEQSSLHNKINPTKHIKSSLTIDFAAMLYLLLPLFIVGGFLRKQNC
jgi:hypothetical protein